VIVPAGTTGRPFHDDRVATAVADGRETPVRAEPAA